MTDNTNATEDLELYDDAKAEFPSKYDLKDRLVAIWVTGKEGSRAGQEGKTYPWIETITLVLDDPEGKTGWDGMVKNEHGDMVETLVPPVEDEGPARLDNFQWSATGIVTRLQPRLKLKDKKTDAPIYRPMIGRINERRSTVRGRNNPWSIAEKTPEDLATIQKYADKIRAITAEVKATREGGSTSDTNDFE